VIPRDFAAESRSAKAQGIADYIEASCGLDPYSEAEQIATFLRAQTTAWWHETARRAGFTSKKPPSPTTQGLVIGIFEQRATSAAHLESA
jgi:hypothetical protein